jgi:XTP/dITP diphosphohydrolase
MLLAFATSNTNKITEVSALMPKGYSVIGLKDIELLDDIPETGTTLKQNSFLKASYVVNLLKQKNNEIEVFADDSGLEVEALNNAPGVYSARYAGIPKNDEANNLKLLKELTNITNRKARFVTVITFISKNQTYYFEGEVKGTISSKLLGNNGFGYDPLFIPQGYDITFAEMTLELKNKISHRAIAIAKFRNFLSKHLTS